ncbi:MAG: hypothetical protein PVI52_09510, partial [Chromatiales bacterium]
MGHDQPVSKQALLEDGFTFPVKALQTPTAVSNQPQHSLSWCEASNKRDSSPEFKFAAFRLVT